VKFLTRRVETQPEHRVQMLKGKAPEKLYRTSCCMMLVSAVVRSLSSASAACARRARAHTHLDPRLTDADTDTDYISDDRDDDFDGVDRKHAFDNDFDLDMHEPDD
jgi:hypothetical protein